jgi:hypothetical protein
MAGSGYNSGTVAEMSGMFCCLLCHRNWDRNFAFNSSSHEDASCYLVRSSFMFFNIETFDATERNIMSSQYMMLFRGTQWSKGLSPQELQNVLNRWNEWMGRLVKEGKVTSAQPLVATGKIISGKKKRIVSDGPFAESKEAIAGYFLLEVEDLNEAVEIAKEVPTVDYGVSVEVRPIALKVPETLEEFRTLKQQKD